MRKAPRRKQWWHHAKQHRERLYAENPVCHWCGTRTHLGKGGGKILATLDHIKSWHECNGVSEWADPANMVLACRACNERRGLEWCRRNHILPNTKISNGGNAGQ